MAVFHRPVYRPPPLMPPTGYKTYKIARPVGSHFRSATCAEVNCSAWRQGWETTIDTFTTLGGRQANYIRLHSGRSYTHTQDGVLVTFRFPAGQTCFRAHRMPVGREPLFARVDGDWRGNPFGTRPVMFKGHRQFIDDFAEHQIRLADRLKRG